MKISNSNVSSILRILSWGVAYYLITWLSLKYFLTEKGVAIAWPSIGIFISAILLSKHGERPFVILVLIAADFLADLHTDVSYFSKFVYALLSAGDAVMSAYVLLHFIGDPFSFSNAKKLLLYVLYSVIICNGFFSLLVAATTHLVQHSDFFNGFLYSWVADGVGNILVVPLIISWSSFSRSDLNHVNTKRIIEIILLLTLLITLNILLFPYSNDGLLFSFIINYLSFPFIIWAILRFDMKIVTMVLLLLTSVMLFNLIRETAIITDSSLNRHFVLFQLYVASIAIISLIITAITSERNQAHKALLESESNYRTVADYTYAWEYWIDENGNIRYMSPAVENVTGYKASAFKSNPKLLDEIVFSEDKYLWSQHKKEMLSNDKEKFSKIEFRINSRDNTIKWIGHDCRQIYNQGTFLGLRVSNRDITSLVEAEGKLLFNTIETEERERIRYSRELHDGLGPLLSTIKMYIQSLSETTDRSKFKLFAEESNNIIKIAIQTMREIAHGISPHNLHHSGFVEAINDFADRINKVHKLTIDFKYNTRVRFSSFYEIIMYRITTELINNTLKYAEATGVEITFNYDRERKFISLKYNDNGKGFDTSIVRRSENGMGLSNIQHRLKVLRGNFKIESEEGKGTRIEIDFPVNEKNVKASTPGNLFM
ncbi:MAG TPA: MASE1 domain-containing protein [Bacteroidales bacterium]|nr:MASE1 domain-containing protein [Bacteroidales bacterium]